MFKKLCLFLLVFLLSSCASPNKHIGVTEEFFHQKHRVAKNTSMDENANNILAFLQNKEESYFNLFKRDAIVEIPYAGLRIFVVTLHANSTSKEHVVYFSDKKTIHIIKCSGPSELVSLTSGKCANMLFKAGKIKLKYEDIYSAINRTPELT